MRARIARLELELLASQADAQRLEDELKSNARAEATAKQWRDRRETEAARLSRNTLPLFTMDWMLSQPDEKIRLYITMKSKTALSIFLLLLEKVGFPKAYTGPHAGSLAWRDAVLLYLIRLTTNFLAEHMALLFGLSSARRMGEHFAKCLILVRHVLEHTVGREPTQMELDEERSHWFEGGELK